MTNLNNSTQEIWKDVKGFEGRYKISNHGNLLSIGGRIKKPTIITANQIDSGGYRNVSLRFQAKGISRYCVRIHQLVAEHFLDKPITTERLEIDHKDRNKLNNSVDNLQWLTADQHRKKTKQDGGYPIGEKHHAAKLTSEQVLKIRQLRSEGKICKEIAEIFGLTRRHVNTIVNKGSWAWL